MQSPSKWRREFVTTTDAQPRLVSLAGIPKNMPEHSCVLDALCVDLKRPISTYTDSPPLPRWLGRAHSKRQPWLLSAPTWMRTLCRRLQRQRQRQQRQRRGQGRHTSCSTSAPSDTLRYHVGKTTGCRQGSPRRNLDVALYDARHFHAVPSCY